MRVRVLVSIISILGAMVICWLLFDSVIVDFMKAPLDMVAGSYATNPFAFRNPLLDILRDRLNPDLISLGRLKVLSVFESITVRFKVSLLSGAILASPIVIWQAWKFVAAGLYQHERRYVTTYSAASLLLFLIGCAFSFFILFPIVAAMLLGNTQFDITLRLEYYVSQATFFTIGVGSMFEMPLVLLFLAKIGVVDVDTLRAKRRHVILAILVIAAMITPPDPLTQIIVAVPMLGLYEISILILKLRARAETS